MARLAAVETNSTPSSQLCFRIEVREGHFGYYATITIPQPGGDDFRWVASKFYRRPLDGQLADDVAGAVGGYCALGSLAMVSALCGWRL